MTVSVFSFKKISASECDYVLLPEMIDDYIADNNTQAVLYDEEQNKLTIMSSNGIEEIFNKKICEIKLDGLEKVRYEGREKFGLYKKLIESLPANCTVVFNSVEELSDNTAEAVDFIYEYTQRGYDLRFRYDSVFNADIVRYFEKEQIGILLRRYLENEEKRTREIQVINPIYERLYNELNNKLKKSLSEE